MAASQKKTTTRPRPGSSPVIHASQPPYPKPGPTGGKILRLMVATLRGAGLELPLKDPVTLAVSGGADSVALARLLTRYGRRIVPFENISILHCNHGWRGEESDGDERSVIDFAKAISVPCSVSHWVAHGGAHEKTTAHPKKKNRESPEEAARNWRKSIYRKRSGWIFTGHTADDLVETVVWRLFTGRWPLEREGIRVVHEREVRPLLDVSRADLIRFLKEENLTWREDSSNSDVRYLRNRIRHELLPQIEAVFSNARSHMHRLARGGQVSGESPKRMLTSRK